jgi:hypothetical protein
MRWILLWALILCIGYGEESSAGPAGIENDPRIEASWKRLDGYQETITRVEFEKRLNALYDPFHGLRPLLTITDTEVTVFTSPEKKAERYRLKFARTEKDQKDLPCSFRAVATIRAQTKEEVPLRGLRLAIDPGHIGGNWAEIENRAIRYPGQKTKLCEGDLNLITAKLLETRLEELGASVFLTRNSTEPVTETRPETLRDEAYARIREKYPARIRRVASEPLPRQYQMLQPFLDEVATFIFYRQEEMRARGDIIRHHFQPDLTVVLYINATPSSSRAKLIDVNQNIFFVHGSYLKDEAVDPAQQPRLLYKLLERGSDIEAEVADHISQAFKQHTGLPPVPYGDSTTTRQVIENNLYVVARNLAANREYDGPVIVTEPYFMNHRITNARLYAGDYEGTREFGGKPYRSIFREYADSVVDGLLSAYGPESFREKAH